MRGQQAAPQQAAQGQPTLPQVVSTAPVAPQEGEILADIAEAEEATVTPPSHTQEQVGTLPQSANGHQPIRPPLAVNGQQAAAQPVEKSETQAATLPQSRL